VNGKQIRAAVHREVHLNLLILNMID